MNSRVEVDVGDELLDQLSEAFFFEEGGYARYKGKRGLNYFIVARVSGLAIKMWADEHPPPHFHVSYQGEDASFSIVDCSRLSGTKGLERFEGRIRSWWRQNQNVLVDKWNSSRPSDCPVGPINIESLRGLEG